MRTFTLALPLAHTLRRWLLWALSIPAFTACEFYYNDTEPTTAPAPLVSFAFPNALGNQWHYQTTTDVAFSTHRVLTTVNSTLTLHRRELLPTNVYADVLVKADSYADGQTVVNETYYTNSPQGLLEHGYTLGDHTVFLKTEATAPQYTLNGQPFASTAELFACLQRGGTLTAQKAAGSLVLHYQAYLTLAYNAYLRDEWSFGLNDNGTATSAKRIVGTQWVNTPAGGFEAVKVSIRYDLDGNGVWDPGVEAYQYWSPEGLVMAEYHAYGVQEYDPATRSYRIADFHQTTRLTGFALR